MTIVARKDFEPTTLAELVDYVKANADTVTYANAGIGAASHLCGMLFMDAIDTQLVDRALPGHRPGDDRPARRPGRLHVRPDHQHHRPDQGRRDQGLRGDDRPSGWTACPTCRPPPRPACRTSRSASGTALYAPAGTPEDVVAKLTAALQAALADENVIARFAELGTAPVPAEQATPEAHAAYLAEQIELWRPIIEEAGVMAQ